jgi:hypothetical protein
MENEAQTRNDQKISGLIVGVSVTVIAGLELLERWNKFDVIGKGLAVLLVLSLVIVPLNMIRREKQGRPENAYAMMFTAYVWVMLVIRTFAHMAR